MALSTFRFYVFGGFGPSTSSLLMRNADFNFVPDNVYHSGWIDQLVYYDIGVFHVVLNCIVYNIIDIQHIIIFCKRVMYFSC